MIRFKVIGLFFLASLVAGEFHAAGAQWRIVAPNLCDPEQQYHGAIRYRDGVGWAGTTALFSSTDSGKTWNPVPSFQPGIKGPQGISDIAIYDSLHILVSIIDDSALYLTTDGGQKWKNIEPPGASASIVQVAFNGSASVIHALEEYPNFSLMTSLDGGTTWRQNEPTHTPSAIALCFAVGADNTIYVFSENENQGWINASTDMGNTWSANSAYTDVDCNTIAVDSCDANRLYLVNENTVEKSDTHSRIDMTTNGGATWQISSIEPLDYFNGSLSSTKQVVYVGGAPIEGTIATSGIGVYRSTDRGISWKNIGGPLESFDTRSIATVDDNIILVLDTGGSVWRTMNSGGDSILSSNLLTFALKPTSITTRPGDTIDIPVYLSGNAMLGATSITLPFVLDKNVLQPIGFYPAISGITVGSIVYGGGTGTVPLQSTGLTLSGETLIGTLRCIVYLADTLATTVTLQSASLTSANSPCVALSLTTDSVNIAITGCGTATLLQFMKTGQIPLAIKSITPNPASGVVGISFINPTSSAISYQVMDVLGTVRAEGEVSGDELTLDVRSLANGLYYLRARDVSVGVTASGKFVVER